MKKERIKSIGIKCIVFAVIFLVSTYAASLLLNRGTTDMTAEMRRATLPVIYMNVNDEYINPLHGYRTEMDSGAMRGALTPLSSNRQVSIKIDPYGSVIKKIAFEVRSMESGRLIEDTALNEFETAENSIRATISLKDLIKDDTEYMLIIKLTNGIGEEIRYYTRIINRAELLLSDKLAFVREFSARTFVKEWGPELKKYMEPNSDGDNTSFAYVNIHSNINQLTWGDLAPAVITDKDLELLEIDSDSASILLSYEVLMKNEVHSVKEYYRISVGKDRMHLMEYERTCDQLFDENKNILVNGKLLHGIIHDLPEYMENSSGSVFAFIQKNALFSYDTSTGNLARVFSFLDADNNDARTRFDQHDIKILSLDEIGNMRFLVYGYMNRGLHEGNVGVALYYYDSTMNTIEEELFVPYYKSYEYLRQDVIRLSYINNRNYFYLMLDGNIFSIRPETRKSELLAGGLSENRFVSTKSNSLIAWQVGNKLSDYTSISLFSLDELEPTQITAKSGEIVIPLGFMDDDFIYGCARLSDITTDASGSEIIPMYCLKIQNGEGRTVKEYRQADTYILSIDISGNMITLSRVVKNSEDNMYYEAEDDQIIDNQSGESFKNAFTSVVTEEMETTYQTVLAKTPASENVKLLTPKELLYEGSKSVDLKFEDPLTRYYVYAKGGIEGIYTDPAEAVKHAEEIFGVVVGKDCRYVWQNGDRKVSTQINGIEASLSDENHSSVALCLDAMLTNVEVYKDTENLLKSGSVLTVLENEVGEDTLDLTGCSLSSVLYYVSRGFPVMAITNEGEALLIVGYDSKNTILYDPTAGTIAKMGKNDSTAFFTENGNRFIVVIGDGSI